ncbi:MAG: ABC transporter ATP-binding protein [Ruminococcus flavefaciens]|nr:ABC transporter ATP-binding protein [Ruminococcus flavefaciens]
MKIEIQNITKTYGKQKALDAVSLNLENGVYGLLGKNGAGKTTLINIFLGILKKDSGNIVLDGIPVSEMGKDFIQKTGYMPQYPRFYKNFRVLEFMRYMGALKGIPQKQSELRIRQLLEEVNLSDSIRKKIGALSGGMRQRLGIAQAMVNDPQILILDEPTAGLDPQERIRFRNLISKFSENRIVLMATHIVSDVEYIASQIIIMNQGKVICNGKIGELEQSINGKVWELSLDSREIAGAEQFEITNMRREEDRIYMRILNDEQPDDRAVLVSPGLEEVFLYYCKGEKGC